MMIPKIKNIILNGNIWNYDSYNGYSNHDNNFYGNYAKFG